MSNAHLRGNNTHVANATDYKIFVRIDENDEEIKSIEHALNTSGKHKDVELKGFYKGMQNFGYMVIDPNELFPFKSDNPHVCVFYQKKRTKNALFKKKKKKRCSVQA